MGTIVLVTGHHRSGTSATAGSLQRLGIELGDKLMPPAGDNPKGFFEDLRVVRVHDQLLSALGARWDKPRAVPADWQDTAAAGKAEARLKALLLDFCQTADTFAIKDPRACLFMPLWQRAAQLTGSRLTVLLTQRRQEAICQSLITRNGWLPDRALGVWNGYEEAISKWAPELPVVVMPFPDGVWQAQEWERVAQGLGITLDITKIGAVHSFLDGGLVHNG